MRKLIISTLAVASVLTAVQAMAQSAADCVANGVIIHAGGRVCTPGHHLMVCNAGHLVPVYIGNPPQPQAC
jgi:hypothetical protein